MHHVPYRTVPMHHFEKIAASTPESFLKMLKADKSNELHHAVQTSAHSAHIAGGHDFHSDGHTHLGGGFWDDVGHGFGKGLSVAGKITAAVAPATALIPGYGAVLAPVLGATGAAMSIGGDAIKAIDILVDNHQEY